jgi:hypothetical protein
MYSTRQIFLITTSYLATGPRSRLCFMRATLKSLDTEMTRLLKIFLGSPMKSSMHYQRWFMHFQKTYCYYGLTWIDHTLDLPHLRPTEIAMPLLDWWESADIDTSIMNAQGETPQDRCEYRNFCSCEAQMLTNHTGRTCITRNNLAKSTMCSLTLLNALIWKWSSCSSKQGQMSTRYARGSLGPIP